jgi:hypothetical protein
MTEPMTMPAISPPDSPFLFEAEAAPPVADVEGDDVDVVVGDVVEKVMKAVMVGKTTPAHRSFAPEL